jgi:serine/threonine protein kinase
MIAGTGHTILAGAGRYSSPSGPSGSLGSSIATYAGQAKTFKFAEIDKATNSFDDSKVLGEGGFGCVYQGTLEDGTTVAVKVLKRYDGQGEREFLAEVEMLGRLHHRNLVKLLGICIEENARCLVYELIPNGSVESHLHGMYTISSSTCRSCEIDLQQRALFCFCFLSAHCRSGPRDSST